MASNTPDAVSRMPVTAKADKRGLDEDQYAGFFMLCLEVLAGRVDATASMASE